MPQLAVTSDGNCFLVDPCQALTYVFDSCSTQIKLLVGNDTTVARIGLGPLSGILRSLADPCQDDSTTLVRASQKPCPIIMERPAPDSQLADYAVNREDPRRRAAYEWEPAMKNVRFVGLDIHALTIAVAVAEAGGEVRSLGTIADRPESVSKLVKKLGKSEQ